MEGNRKYSTHYGRYQKIQYPLWKVIESTVPIMEDNKVQYPLWKVIESTVTIMEGNRKYSNHYGR